MLFSLSSVLPGVSCFAFNPCSEATSFNSTTLFDIKHEFTACDDSCSLISAERWQELESLKTLRKVKILHAILDSTSVLKSFPGVCEQPFSISSALLMTTSPFSACIVLNVGSTMFRSSSIILNVSAGSSAVHHGKRGAKAMPCSRDIPKIRESRIWYFCSRRYLVSLYTYSAFIFPLTTFILSFCKSSSVYKGSTTIIITILAKSPSHYDTTRCHSLARCIVAQPTALKYSTSVTEYTYILMCVQYIIGLI